MLEKYKKERRWAKENFDAGAILFFLVIFYLLSLLRYVDEGINKTFWPCYTFPLFLLSLFYYSVGKCNSHIYKNDIFIKAGKRISLLAIIYGIIVFFYILNNRSSVFYEYFVFHILCIFSIVKWLYFFMKEDK